MYLEGRCACTLSQERLLCLSSLCNCIELAARTSAWKYILFKKNSEFRLWVQPLKAKAKRECYCSLRMEESSRTLRSNEEGNKKLQNRRFESNLVAWEKARKISIMKGEAWDRQSPDNIFLLPVLH